MIKRISFILVLIFIALLLSVSVFAAGGNKSDKKEAEEKKPLFITITKPSSESEKTFNKDYTVCGITEKSNIRIELYKMKSEKSYVEFKDVDGLSAWDVGPSGIFSIDIKLSMGNKKDGINYFGIKAFDKDKPEIFEFYDIKITLLDVNKLKKESAKDYSLDKILKPLSK